MIQIVTRSGFGFGRCRVRLPLRAPAEFLGAPCMVANASFLSQPRRQHVRTAWRSLRAGGGRLLRAVSSARVGPILRVRDTCVLISNNCANDTPKMRNFDRKRSRMHART